jgi:O-antigen/teichoic acid export membrane protein
MNASWHSYLPAFLRDRLEGRHGLQSAIGNTAWLFADRLVRMAVGLVVGIWMARELGPGDFGILSYSIALTSILGGLASLGLDGILVRELANRPDRRNVLLGSAFAVKLAGGLATTAISIAAVAMIRPGDALSLVLVAISASAFICQSLLVVDLFHQSRVESRRTVVANMAAFLPATLARIGLLVTHSPVVYFAWVALAEALLLSAFLVHSYRRNFGQVRDWTVDLGVARNLLRQSWPLVFASFAVMVQAKVDQVMLGQFVGDGEVGQYSAALRVVEAIAFLPVIVASTLAPHIATARLRGMAEFEARLCDTYRLMFILFVVLAIPLALAGGPAVLALFGEDYSRAAALLPLLAVRLFFANFGIAKSLFITNESLFAYSLVASLVGAAVNVAANMVLIPRYQAEGAIIAGIISFGVTIFAADLFMGRTRRHLRLMLRAIVSPLSLGGHWKDLKNG